MRQPGGQYVDSGGNAYSVQMQQQQRMPAAPRMNHKSNDNYQGRPSPADHHLNSKNDNSYGDAASKGEGQWRSAPHMLNEGAYYQSHGEQRADQRLTAEKQQGNDLRSQPREEDMEIGYQDNTAAQTFEALEQRFYDDILKLTKQQNDAEDVENARHRERVNAINAQYEEQLGALRARHTNRRDELLRRESHARQQQYQHAAAVEQPFTNNALGFSDPPHVDSYRDRPRFTGGNRDTRDPGFDPRGQYPGGRAYGSGSRYY